MKKVTENIFCDICNKEIKKENTPRAGYNVNNTFTIQYSNPGSSGTYSDICLECTKALELSFITIRDYERSIKEQA